LKQELILIDNDDHFSFNTTQQVLVFFGEVIARGFWGADGIVSLCNCCCACPETSWVAVLSAFEFHGSIFFMQSDFIVPGTSA